MKKNGKKFISVFICLLLFSFVCFAIGYSMNIDINSNPNLSLGFWDVLSNNLKVNIMAILYAILSVGIYSLIYLAKEMFFLGVIIKSLKNTHSLFYAISFIGCHGIIEIPSMVLSGTIGIYVWINIIAYLKKKEFDFKFTITMFVVLLSMILIAAMVETTITPWFLKKYVI
ncbi:stage II sporulation protein M [Clostridium intestinale]|uniref:Uncharacterized membrane protein SpoIIM, required for sporulation n=1 Tax=Clostridium intestinale DSM 6191 TaxID=1121320 RepID=A0A1M5YHK9_9CLOT|nr:stage II sporulation protein M [Clostridium intestinale]SHI11520.1 Uncharacterized membrane protein SpoIIM, required for sporulation [Clostridium intestinale DSM 6191]